MKDEAMKAGYYLFEGDNPIITHDSRRFDSEESAIAYCTAQGFHHYTVAKVTPIATFTQTIAVRRLS
jgi:hypothetical protein